MRYRALLCPIAFACLACAGDAPSGDPIGLAGLRDAAQAGQTVGQVELSPAPAAAVAGQQFVLAATVKGENGVALTDRAVTWTSSDPAAATVWAMTDRRPLSSVFVTRTGDPVPVTISATVEGRSASVTFMAVASGPPSAALKVDAVTMVEFQYPSAPGHWFYAPQLRVTEPTGKGAASIASIDFAIPGFGPAPQPCQPQGQIAPGQTVDVYREIYGDYQLSFDHGGERPTGPNALAVVHLREPFGQIVLTVPIVAGDLPKTYSGGTIAC